MTERSGRAESPRALPQGAHDALPVEAAELRELGDRVRTAFALFGYREVVPSSLEFSAAVSDVSGSLPGGGYRLFDPQGRVIVLRPDYTLAISRLAGTRFPAHPGPVRLSYIGRVFRPPPMGKPRLAEQLQAGAELIDAGGPEADAEVISLMIASLAAANAGEVRVAVGDVELTEELLRSVDLGEDDRDRLRRALRERDIAGWGAALRATGVSGEAAELLSRLPRLRGGPESLEEIIAAVPGAEGSCRWLARTLELIAAHGGDATVSLDLSVVRDRPYYSGVVFEAHVAGVASPVAAGGRYDSLSGRFGERRSAAGFGISLQVLNRVLNRAAAAPIREGVVLVGAMAAALPAAVAARAAGIPVVALPDGGDAEALAVAEGWRYAATASDEGLTVLDRRTDERFTCTDLGEALPSRR